MSSIIYVLKETGEFRKPEMGEYVKTNSGPMKVNAFWCPELKYRILKLAIFESEPMEACKLCGLTINKIWCSATKED